MHLELSHPLVILDFEATGLNPRYDRIVEIGALKVHPDGRRETYEQRINPERPIPPQAMAVHGIRDADVAAAPTFGDIADRLHDFLRGCDLAGFGIEQYDLPLLKAEFGRVGIHFDARGNHVIDAKTIFHKKEPRDLSAALDFYCGKRHDGAHSAMDDVNATFDVLQQQTLHYDDLPRDADGLARFCNPPDADAVDPEGRLRWAGDEIVLAFGQKRGLSLRQLMREEPGYLKWILKKDFSDDVKSVVRDALAGRFRSRTG